MVGPDGLAEEAQTFLFVADEGKQGAAGGVAVAEGLALRGGAGLGVEVLGVEVQEGIDFFGIRGRSAARESR